MMKWIRSVAAMNPPFVRKGLLSLAKRVRTEVFGLPDPFDDLGAIGRVLRPAAILDIGAHVGETSRELAQLQLKAPIFAFEPSPDTVTILRERTRAIKEVSVQPFALGDTNGTLPFFINSNSQTNSLLDNDWANRDLMGGETAHVNQINVPVKTLDGWVAEHLPAGDLFIKADVQGTEGKLVEGGRATFASRVAAFYTEVSLAPLYKGQISLFELHELLSKNSPLTLFQMYRTRSSTFGMALWMDVLYVRKDVVEMMRRNDPGAGARPNPPAAS